jgi:hypothetical protein
VELASWVPPEVDTELPSAARVYDYLLGGGHNFAADRQLGERFLLAQPHARAIARYNRSFLRRAVLHLLDQGIRQFLDLGSGIPTVGNVHEITRRAASGARVVYVDYEAIAVAHTRMILRDEPLATMVQQDMTEPAAVLDAALATGLLDLAEPLGLLAIGCFHLVPPAREPGAVLGAYRDAVASGSHLALSHWTADLQPAEMAGIVEVMKKSANPVFPRTHAEISGLLAGFDLVEPGVVPLPLWRPDGISEDDPEQAGLLAAVGRKS